MSTITADAQYVTEVSGGSRAQQRVGRILSSLVVLFLAVDGIARMAGFAPYIEGTIKYGYAAELAPWLGGVLVVATAVYVFPGTAVIGAILVTGYLGGATATHVRAGEPWFFPVAMGVLAWVGLLLRSPEVRALLLAPLHRGNDRATANGKRP